MLSVGRAQLTTTRRSVLAMTITCSSVWNAGGDAANFAALGTDRRVNTVVIGAGITGIMTAHLLAQAGQSVAVLEAKTVGSGTTGMSTGNLYALVDEYLHRLIDHWSLAQAQRVVQSRRAALDRIEANIIRYQLDCDFTRVPWVLYAVGGAARKCNIVQEEYEAARALGLPARLWGCMPFVFPVDRALVVPGQAQFNPLRYVRGLAAAIAQEYGARCTIHEHTPALAIDSELGIVRTPRHTVYADRIVMATHTPKGVNILQTEVAPYREYTVAGPLATATWPRGIYWAVEEAAYSTRSLRIADHDYLLTIGQKHKVGQQVDTNLAYAALQRHARRHYGVQRFDFQWSAQHYRSADGLPYIGRAAGARRTFIATGFANDGLVYGAVAAQVLSDEILGKANPYAALYSPRRFTPLKSAPSFLAENANATSYLLRDRWTNGKVRDLAAIQPGEGRIVESDGRKLAVYRDESGALHAVSAVCTHLKGIVHWNSAERSWDCPCHGSRFDVTGQVIEGPTLMPLSQHMIVEEVRREAPVASGSATASASPPMTMLESVGG